MRHGVLLGPPGSGKGTQAALLVQRLGAQHLSTGRLLRQAIAAQTPLGREAQGAIEQGLLVPDATVNALVRETLLALPPEAPLVLFDGYPRSISQAAALDQTLRELTGHALDIALLLDLSDDEVIRRLAGRRECPQCGGVFNVVSAVPSDGSECKECGGSNLTQRADDRPGAITRRLEVYHRETQPLESHYASRGLLHRIAAAAGPATVHSRIMDALAGAGSQRSV
ncbi:MAG: nucleoside monophosphate kinase [Candidatus Sumerlaeia bacterium]|nr:nucleoside monophosphate kinase [Candidatus Sumerlaeia bacterium]